MYILAIVLMITRIFIRLPRSRLSDGWFAVCRVGDPLGISRGYPHLINLPPSIAYVVLGVPRRHLQAYPIDPLEDLRVAVITALCVARPPYSSI